MADIGLEAVLADQHDGAAAAAGGERRDVDVVALAVGQQQDVGGVGMIDDAVQRGADRGAAIGCRQAAHQRRRGRAAPRADPLRAIAEFPQLHPIGGRQPGEEPAEVADRHGMLGLAGAGAEGSAHRAGMVDQDGEMQRRLTGRRRRDVEDHPPSVGAPTEAGPRHPGRDREIDRPVVRHRGAARDEAAAGEPDRAAVAFDLQLGGAGRRAADEIVDLGQARAAIDFAHGERQPQMGGAADQGERQREAGLDLDLGAGRHRPDRQHVDAAQQLLVQHREPALLDRRLVGGAGRLARLGVGRQRAAVDPQQQLEQHGMDRQREGQHRLDAAGLAVDEAAHHADLGQPAADGDAVARAGERHGMAICAGHPAVHQQGDGVEQRAGGEQGHRVSLSAVAAAARGCARHAARGRRPSRSAPAAPRG
ncbi:MAG: hypothetical protein U1E53_26105 [Dongiaceae bacterium]